LLTQKRLFLDSGGARGIGLQPGGKKKPKGPESLIHFGDHFGMFASCFGSGFLLYFLVDHFWALGDLKRHFVAIRGAGPTCQNQCVIKETVQF